VRAAERAVSDDSAESLASRWRAALARDSSDRAALLGLATLANLQYDFPTSERLLSKLLGQTEASPDRWRVFIGRDRSRDSLAVTGCLLCS
jgi:hypothetical protein